MQAHTFLLYVNYNPYTKLLLGRSCFIIMNLLKSGALLCTFAAAFVFTSCGSDDEGEKFSISESKLTLHFEETEQLSATTNVTWSSENEFVAIVNSNGLVEGGHVGKTNIVATSTDGNSAKCEVEIVPVYSTYKEPYLEFGASKATVKSKETRKLYKEQTSSLAYEGENSFVELVLYSFDDNGKLKGASIALSLACASEVTKFLLERYQPAAVEDGVYLFINGNAGDFNMGVALSVESSYLAIVYLPSSSKGRSIEFENCKEELKSLFDNVIKSKGLK